jgi:hypothetical protein
MNNTWDIMLFKGKDVLLSKVQLHLDLVRVRNRVVYDTLATPCIVGELPGGGVVVHCEWISRRKEKTSTCVMRLCGGLV